MEQVKTTARRWIAVKSRFFLWAFGVITLAHLFLFVRYSYTPEVSIFTQAGEYLKMTLPVLLLITLFPKTHNKLDRIIKPLVINLVSLVFIILCLIYQLTGVPGQAWSTVVFSGALILLLYNHLLTRHITSNTVAFVFSFMVVWLGWVTFEVMFQVGLWAYHPEAFDYNIKGLARTLIIVGGWALPAIVYIYAVVKNKIIKSDIKVYNLKWAMPLLAICITATAIWFARGMLIPIPIGSDGTPYALQVNYWTIEHLDFTISRLSQISLMVSFAVLFFKKGEN